MGLFGFKSSNSNGSTENDNTSLPVAAAVAVESPRRLPPPVLPPRNGGRRQDRQPAPSAPLAPPQSMICFASPPDAATTVEVHHHHHHNEAASPLLPPVQMYLSRRPMALRPCPYCHRNSTTRVVMAPGEATWCSVGFLVVVLTVVSLAMGLGPALPVLGCPVWLLPLFVDSMRLTNHYCDHCHAHVGSVRPYADCCVTTRT